MKESLVVGVDIGGSHITVALIDCEKKSILDGSYVRKRINSAAGADEILADWVHTIEECRHTSIHRANSIGIAMPGPFDYEEGISYMKDQNKYDALYGINLRNQLAYLLEIVPEQLHFSNDAACFLQGELFSDAGNKTDTVGGFTLGTGFGSAISQEGFATDANLWCAPFMDATVEDYLSTRWFIARYKALTGAIIKDVYALTQLSHDPVVKGIFDLFGRHLAKFLIEFYQKYRWNRVVLGGNIAQSYSLFSATLLQALADQRASIQISVSSLGEQAALVGAASYASKTYSA